MAPFTDKETIHFIINRGVFYALLVLVAAVTLALLGQKEFAIFLAGGIAGTSNNLFGMLAKTSGTPSNAPDAPPTPVQVTNTATDPVPTTAMPAPTPAPETEGETA